MTTSKMTYSQAIEAVLNGEMTEAVCERLRALQASLNKKSASPKKLTSQQEKNEMVKTAILDFLSDHKGEGFTCSDLIKQVPELEDDSNQHVSALMRALRLANKVENYTDKRKTYFRIKVGE